MKLTNEVKLGILVVVFFIILGLAVAFLGKLKFKEDGYILRVRFSFIGDLKIGAPVIFAGGIRVGKVIDIVAQKDKVEVIIKQNDDDLYAAIDLAIARAQKAMRRMHDKDSGHHKVGLNEVKSQDADVKAATLDMEDEIVPVELSLYKPREVEDVLNDLKDSTKMFEIFIDHEDKTRVLYKRDDGKFGLY